MDIFQVNQTQFYFVTNPHIHLGQVFEVKLADHQYKNTDIKNAT